MFTQRRYLAGLLISEQSAFGARLRRAEKDNALAGRLLRNLLALASRFMPMCVFDRREKNYARAIKSFLLYRKAISYKVKKGDGKKDQDGRNEQFSRIYHLFNVRTFLHPLYL